QTGPPRRTRNVLSLSWLAPSRALLATPHRHALQISDIPWAGGGGPCACVENARQIRRREQVPPAMSTTCARPIPARQTLVGVACVWYSRLTMAKKKPVDQPHMRMPVSASTALPNRHCGGSTMSPYPVVVYVTALK